MYCSWIVDCFVAQAILNHFILSKSTTIHQKGLGRYNSVKNKLFRRNKNSSYIKILGLPLWTDIYTFIRLKYTNWQKKKTIFLLF